MCSLQSVTFKSVEHWTYRYIFCPSAPVHLPRRETSHRLSQFDLSGTVSGSFASGLPAWLNINTTFPLLNGILMRCRRERGDGGWWWDRGMRRWRGGRRMYPQPSCGVSNMALVPLRKKREIEQINTDHQIPAISFTSPPAWIKVQRGGGWCG